MEHLLKVAAWPDMQSSGHWQSEAALFLANAEAQFAPSMGQTLDLPRLYATALRSVRLIDRIDGLPPGPLRPDCPFTLTELFAPDLDVRAAAASLRDGTGQT